MIGIVEHSVEGGERPSAGSWFSGKAGVVEGALIPGVAAVIGAMGGKDTVSCGGGTKCAGA